MIIKNGKAMLYKMKNFLNNELSNISLSFLIKSANNKKTKTPKINKCVCVTLNVVFPVN